MEQLPLLVILGPTATGKTELSLHVAKKINGEIISADSMQIYRDMDIGTAKVKQEIRNEIPHHMIDIISPEEEFSVAEYQEMVDELISSIHKQNKFPIMVGGTGLYIKAVIEGFLLPDMEKDPGLRKKLRTEASKYGNKHVHNKLKEVDPPLAEKLHPNDLRRVIRGIEICHQTGKTKTEYIREQKNKPDRYNALKIGLTRNRNKLYERINKRVDIMLKKGLITEVENLQKKYKLSKTARQALGYKEIISYLNGKIDKKEAINEIKQGTRHLAKKQLTWFKRDERINWINLSQTSIKEAQNNLLSLYREYFN